MKAFQRKKRPFLSLDDIVFEHRNKEYGCYKLRSRYQRRLRLSFLLVLGFFLFVILLVYVWKINPLNEDLRVTDNSYVESVYYDPELFSVINKLAVVKPVVSKILESGAEAENPAEQVKRTNIPVMAVLPKPDPVFPVADTSQKKLADELLRRHKISVSKANSDIKDTISIILEKTPQFPGGYAAIQTYFYRNQHYPENALLKGKQGSTIVSFIVNKEGYVEKASVVKGSDPELDMEAIRLIRTMPLWEPAYYKNKPISCMVFLPVQFTIK